VLALYTVPDIPAMQPSHGHAGTARELCVENAGDLMQGAKSDKNAGGGGGGEA
jgi:hypothetical protein